MRRANQVVIEGQCSNECACRKVGHVALARPRHDLGVGSVALDQDGVETERQIAGQRHAQNWPIDKVAPLGQRGARVGGNSQKPE